MIKLVNYEDVGLSKDKSRKELFDICKKMSVVLNCSYQH